MALQEELAAFKYRSFLPLIILVIGTILYLRTELYPETFFLEEAPYEIYFERVCLFISLFDLIIRFTPSGILRPIHRKKTKEQLIVLTLLDIYSLACHSLYLGIFFMLLDAALMTGNFWFVMAFNLHIGFTTK